MCCSWTLFADLYLFPHKLPRSEHLWGIWPVADCPPSGEEEEEVEETEDESYSDTPCVVRAACPPD